jgi:hypothetical protein
MEDSDMQWQLDRDVIPTPNLSDIAQPPERVRRFPSEFERVDNTLRQLPLTLPRASQQPRPTLF